MKIIERKDWKIPKTQSRVLDDGTELKKIKDKLERYLKAFIKACEKKREDKEFIFKCSTLHSYKSLLVSEKKETEKNQEIQEIK